MQCSLTPVFRAGSRAAESTPRSLCVACSLCSGLSGSCGRRGVLAPGLVQGHDLRLTEDEARADPR
jgi:hypothetical protein